MRPIQDFTIGNVVAASGDVLARAYVPIGAITILAVGGQYVPALIRDPLFREAPALAEWSWEITFFIEILVSALTTGAIVYGVVRVMLGRPMYFRTSLARAAALMIPLIAVELILSSPTILAHAVQPWFVTALIQGSDSAASTLLTLRIFNGLVHLAELIGWSILWCAIRAVVFERCGLGGSLRRSLRLTQEFRFRIFAILVILSVAYSVLVSAASYFLVGIFDNQDVASHLLRWVNHILWACQFAAWTVACGVSYVQLRAVKEGWNTGDVAAVFD